MGEWVEELGVLWKISAFIVHRHLTHKHCYIYCICHLYDRVVKKCFNMISIVQTLGFCFIWFIILLNNFLIFSRQLNFLAVIFCMLDFIHLDTHMHTYMELFGIGSNINNQPTYLLLHLLLMTSFDYLYFLQFILNYINILNYIK